MHKNQFFYTITNPDSKEEKRTKAFFDVTRVVRGVEYEPGKLVILLDDFHEEVRNIPSQNKNGKVTMTKVTETVASEVFLNEEDSVRYEELTTVSEPVV